MSDLIDRQAAIDAVEESRRLNHHQDGKEACCHEYEHRHFLKILMELPSAQPEQRWISVSERLPEDDGLYLVTTSKGQVQVHVFNHDGNSEEYWMRCNKAWMPLPEPYREEKQDEGMQKR